MKSRVGYFGDSFVDDKFNWDTICASMNPENLWTNVLAKRLNIPYLNHAHAGTGLDHILTRLQFELLNNNIGSDDLIILGLTSWDRKWLVRDQPEVSHIINLQYDHFWQHFLGATPPKERPKLKKQMEIAWEYYVHSWNNTLSYIEHSAFHSHLIWLRDNFNLSLIVIPTFEPLIVHGKEYCPDPNKGHYEVTGFLNNASLNEFAGDYEKRRDHYVWNVWGKNGIDRRANHLSLENHDILADKIYNTLMHNDPLDLEENFIKDIYK